MPSPGKGKAKKNLGRKETKATQEKVTGKRQQNTRDSRVSVEIVESMDTKLLIGGTSSRPNLTVKARERESRNPMTKISDSDSSKQVDETWSANTSAQQPSSLQGNTIECADEGLWIFSLEDSKKRRYTVNW